MNSQILPQGALRRTSSLFYVIIAGGLLSSCTTFRSKAPQAEADSRSELVFLNIDEASGWVAYNCNPGEPNMLEDYRVVVIRQNSGEIIYDSQIPLASNLCTHGFEMSPDDPRLKKLSQNVDSGIIEPLEAFQKSIKETEDVEIMEEATEPEEVSAEEISDEGASEAPVVEETESDLTMASKSEISERGKASTFQINTFDQKTVELELTENHTLETGDRLFLREQPTLIKIPGAVDEMIRTDGIITGLVQVTEIDGNKSVAKILSGSVPEGGIAETVKKP